LAFSVKPTLQFTLRVTYSRLTGSREDVAIEDELTAEQQQRLAALRGRVEAFKSRGGPAKDRAELHTGFREINAIFEEFYDLAGDSAKERAADILPIFQFLENVTSADPAVAADAREKLLSSKSLKHFIAKRIFASIPSQLSESAITELKDKFRGLQETDRLQTLYLQKLALTDDAFGIVVRGHVLIENALQACIYAYVPNPADLYRRLEMFFSQKIRLAHMLGIISADEKLVLDMFNRLRNQLAHYGHGTQSEAPDFHLTAEHERPLWEQFIKAPSMGGDWPEYDASIFPTHLRYIVMQLCFTFSGRAKDLEERKLSPIVDELVPQEDSRMLSYITKLSINLFAALGGTDEAET
jgi:hypothetical protein